MADKKTSKFANGLDAKSIEEMKKSKEEFKEKSREEIKKIVFQLFFWGILALFFYALYKKGVINEKTEMPAVIDHYISEKLNVWVYGVEVLLLLIIAGIAAISGSKSFVLIAKEEISRLFYTLGCFSSAISLLIGLVESNSMIYLYGAIILVVMCGAGFCIAVYLRPLGEVKK